MYGSVTSLCTSKKEASEKQMNAPYAVKPERAPEAGCFGGDEGGMTVKDKNEVSSSFDVRLLAVIQLHQPLEPHRNGRRRAFLCFHF
jgi:hypothetical protein